MELKFIPIIGDVRIPSRSDFVFRTYYPQVGFHAAAYKHVPLMEENPCEAVLVNVCQIVKKMVMILTDMAIAEELEELSRKVKIPDMAKLMKKTVPEFKSKNSRSEKYDK